MCVASFYKNKILYVECVANARGSWILVKGETLGFSYQPTNNQLPYMKTLTEQNQKLDPLPR